MVKGTSVARGSRAAKTGTDDQKKSRLENLCAMCHDWIFQIRKPGDRDQAVGR